MITADAPDNTILPINAKAPGIYAACFALLKLPYLVLIYLQVSMKGSYTKLLLFSLSLLFATIVKSEENKNPIPKNADIAHLSQLIDKAWDFMPNNLDSLIYYLEKSKDIVHAPDSEIKADYFNALGIYYFYKGKPTEGIQAFGETLKIDQEKITINQQVVAYNNLGMLLNNIGKTTEAMHNLEKALELDELRENRSGVAKHLYDLSRLHAQSGHNELALNYIQQAIKIQQELDESFRLMRSVNMLGNIYIESHLNDEAAAAYRRSLSLAANQNDTGAMATAYNNISALYSNMDDKFDSTLYYAEKGKALVMQSVNAEFLPILNANIARAYQHAGDNKEALRFFRKTMGSIDQLRSSSLKSEVLLNVANAHKAIAQYDSANYFLDKALLIAESGKFMPLLERVYRSKASIDSIENRLGDYIFHLHKGLAIRDSMQLRSNQARIAELMIINEVELKSAEIEMLMREREWNKTLLLIYFSVSLLIITSLLFVLLYLRNRKTIVQQKLQLQGIEKEQYKAKADKLALEAKLNEEEVERVYLEAELREQEHALNSVKQANMMLVNQSIREKLGPYQFRFSRKKDQDAFIADLNALCNSAERDPLSEFEAMFSQMHSSFFEKIIQVDNSFTRSELQVCALLRMNLPSKEIANMLHLSLSRVDQTRHQIRKKLNLDASQNLTSYLILL